MDLAIIVVSYHVRELLAGCLDSVFQSLEQSPQVQAEVWVVDNASADGSAEMVRSRFPKVRLVASEMNLGFARGNNLAMEMLALDRGVTPPPARAKPPDAELGAPLRREGGPRYVLLLNPDTVVQGDALARMVAFMDATPMAGACGAQLAFPDGSFQHSAFQFAGLAQIAFDFFPPPGRLNRPLLDSRWNGRYSHRLYESGQPFPVDFVLGATLMVRVEAIRRAGLLDEGYFMYCEEMDWQRRLHAAGWRVYCVPSARVIHYGGASTSQFGGAMFVALWRSRFKYFDRYHSRPYTWLAGKLVRAGVRVEARRAQKLQPPDLAQRMAAYETVGQIGKSASRQP